MTFANRTIKRLYLDIDRTVSEEIPVKGYGWPTFNIIEQHLAKPFREGQSWYGLSCMAWCDSNHFAYFGRLCLFSRIGDENHLISHKVRTTHSLWTRSSILPVSRTIGVMFLVSFNNRSQNSPEANTPYSYCACTATESLGQ